MSTESVTRVLIVDDDDAIRALLERVLKREKFVVESARDGFEAIEKLSQNDYAMILLDLRMPRVDGHGVLRFLENDLQRPKPSVIVMTANLQSAQSADAPSVVGVLPKPFDLRQLVSRVRACSERSAADASEKA